MWSFPFFLWLDLALGCLDVTSFFLPIHVFLSILTIFWKSLLLFPAVFFNQVMPFSKLLLKKSFSTQKLLPLKCLLIFCWFASPPWNITFFCVQVLIDFIHVTSKTSLIIITTLKTLVSFIKLLILSGQESGVWNILINKWFTHRR